VRSAVVLGGLVLALAFTPARSTTTPLEGVPAFDHVAVLILENENFDASWGPGSVAHYLNSLRSVGVFADQYFAIGHVSLDNYIAMISGQPANPLSGTDCAAVNLFLCVLPQSLYADGRNLADQLEKAGFTWKGYMDSMPSPCFHADYSPTALPPDPYQGNSQEPPAKDYADRHNPFIYFDDIVGNDARCKAHVRPYTELAGDLAADALPAFSFITPDTCHDGHDSPCSNGAPGGLYSADAWLSNEVPPLLSYLQAHNGVLIVTFDENGFTDGPPFGCCTGGPLGVLPGFGGRVGLVAVGAGLTPGKVVHTEYDHMSLLRTIEDAFGISEHLNNADSAHAMSDLFN
jgi:phosphatidylinositol-3-phosphatase